jgi:ribosome-binding protein aMBF1 (putative translation factor)
MPEFNRLTADDDLDEGLAEAVAIVPRGAVGRTIAFRKEHPMKTAEILKACAEMPLENEAQLDKVLKEAGLEGEALDAAKAIARLTAAFSDKLEPDTVVKALNATVAKAGHEGDKYEYGKQKKDMHDDDDDDEDEAKRFGAALKALAKSRGMSAAKLAQETEEEEEEMKKLLKGAKRPTSKQLSKIARALGVKVAELKKEAPTMSNDPTNANSPSAVLARILKGDTAVDLSVIEDPETRAAFQIFKAEQVAKDEKIAKIEKALEAETDRRVRKELVEEIEKKYHFLPGAKVDDLATTLQALRKDSPEAAAQLEKVLESSSAAIEKGLLGELTGDAFHTGAASNAISRVEQAAEAILKSGEKDAISGKAMTKEMAIDLALQREPDMYHDYTDEAGIDDRRSH